MSTDEMSGTYAFEHVVDKLVEEGRRNAGDVERRVEAERRLQIAEQTLNNVRSDLTTARASLAEYVAGIDTFGKLYDAIDEAVKRLRLGDGENQNCGAILNNRMVDAKKFIDPIPF